jgi:hypothetical protein
LPGRSSASIRHLGREVPVGVEHDASRLREGSLAGGSGERRVAVVVVERLEAEQPGLQPVVAGHEVGAVLAGGHQRADGVTVDLVGEIPLVHRLGEATQAVAGSLVLGECVEDEGQQPPVLLQPFRERSGGGPTHLAGGVVEAREHLLLAQLVGAAVDLQPEAHPAGELVEQPREGTPPGVGGLLEQPLLGLRQQVRAIAPEASQEVCPPLEAGRVEQGRRVGIVDARPLEAEEQDLVLDLGGALLHALEQRAVARLAGVAGEEQPRIALGALHGLLHCLELGDRLGESAGVELRHPAAMPLGEGFRPREGKVEVALEIVDRRVEVCEVPAHPGGRAGVEALRRLGVRFRHGGGRYQSPWPPREGAAPEWYPRGA